LYNIHQKIISITYGGYQKFILESQIKSMHLSQILSLSLFTIALTLTVYVWLDRLRGTNASINEAFVDAKLDDATIAKINKAVNSNPTDDDAIKAHQTLLRYMKNDFGKGIKFVIDFGKRFFENPKIRKDLDVTTLMNNYSSPLQVV
jgi:hypothetical protein